MMVLREISIAIQMRMYPHGVWAYIGSEIIAIHPSVKLHSLMLTQKPVDVSFCSKVTTGASSAPQDQGVPTCQRWDSLAPHTHDEIPENYPHMGLADNTFCRNPNDNPGDAWGAWGAIPLIHIRKGITVIFHITQILKWLQVSSWVLHLFLRHPLLLKLQCYLQTPLGAA